VIVLFNDCIGDIAMDGGGLAYLEDSSNIGKSTEEDFNTRATHFSREQRISAYNVNMAAGGVITEDALDYTEKTGQGRKWLIADYEAGDVVFHDPFMVHTATVNQSEKGIIRLSTDLRFYERGDDMDERWMSPWFPGDGL
jgi:phytanoyl-CoA hydroxylase